MCTPSPPQRPLCRKCHKYARDITSGLCSSHGGGRRCEVESCSRGAQSGTTRCVRHMGGRRCEADGCQHAAVSASKPYCSRHGGGRFCDSPGCRHIARARSSFCIQHGGARRPVPQCQVEGCRSGARGGTRRCARHGGNRRCLVPDCSSRPKDNNDYCDYHLCL